MKVLLYRTPGGRETVQAELEALPKADLGKVAEVEQGIREYGLDYQGAGFRQLRGKLWELRFRTRRGNTRIAYCVVSGDTMVWLRLFFKKSARTPARELEIALKRMREVLS